MVDDSGGGMSLEMRRIGDRDDLTLRSASQQERVNLQSGYLPITLASFGNGRLSIQPTQIYFFP